MQSAAEIPNRSMTAGNFRCRSIRSINILASGVRSLSIGLAFIHDVALTVIGTPLTWFVIAKLPMGSWAKACDPRTTANKAVQQSALMAQPHQLKLLPPKRLPRITSWRRRRAGYFTGYFLLLNINSFGLIYGPVGAANHNPLPLILC